jgi:hypothetical protein
LGEKKYAVNPPTTLNKWLDTVYIT